MIRVRNYGFPGFFSEANPESSTRNTGTKHPRRIWFAPGYVRTDDTALRARTKRPIPIRTRAAPTTIVKVATLSAK